MLLEPSLISTYLRWFSKSPRYCSVAKNYHFCSGVRQGGHCYHLEKHLMQVSLKSYLFQIFKIVNRRLKMQKKTHMLKKKNIICRCSLPREIVTNNSSQVISTIFQQFCSELGIKLSCSTSRNPQVKAQVESSNKTIIATLKKNWKKKKVVGWTNLHLSFGRSAL